MLNNTYNFCCVVLTMAVRIRISSSQSLHSGLKSNITKLLAFNNLSQYMVSLASLEAMDIFVIKSLRVCAAVPSATFAPILVPDLSTCLPIAYS